MEKFDDKYIKIAKIWAENSHAIRHKVGAIIVKDNAIISDGYNGTPTGFDNACEEVKCGEYKDRRDCLAYSHLHDSSCPCNKCDKSYLETKSIVIHAECNALMKLAKGTQSSVGATLYVTLSPCCECAKMIIQSGIKRVVYCEEYRDTKGLDILRQAGILVEQINIE